MYPLLFVSALCIVPCISTKLWLRDPIKFDNNGLKAAKESIEWGWIWGRTKNVPTGQYAVFKKVDNEYKSVLGKERKEDGKCIDLYKWDDDFSWSGIYIVIGMNGDFDEEGYFMDDTAKDAKSSETCWLVYSIVAIVMASIALLMCFGCCCACYIRKS